MSETKTILGAITDLGNKIALAFEPKEKAEKKYEDMTDEEKAEYDKKKASKKDDAKVGMAEEKVIEVKVDTVELEKVNKAMKDLSVELSTIVKDALKPIQDANLELTKQVETLKEEVVELGKQPASPQIKTAPTSIDLSTATEWEKRKHYRQNNG